MRIPFILFALLFQFSIYAQTVPELFPSNDRKAGYFGYYLKDGTNVVKPQFCSASYNTDGYYLVSKAEHELDDYGNRKERHLPNTEKFGLLNDKGQFVIDFENDYDFFGITKGVIYVKKNNFYGVVNSRNEIVVPIENDELDIQNQEIIIAKKKNKFGVINQKNKIIIPFIYHEIHLSIDKKEIYAENKDYRYYFTIDGKLLKKEKNKAILKNKS